MCTAKCLSLLLIAAAMNYPLVSGQQYEGDACKLSNSRGTCRVISDCQPVMSQLISGKRPEKLCGYSGSLPIVCCPSSSNTNQNQQTTTTTTTYRPVWSEYASTRKPVVTSHSRLTSYSTRRPTTGAWSSNERWSSTSGTTASDRVDKDDRAARRMCSEYAKSVFQLVDTPTLSAIGPQQVNKSECAIKSRKLIVGGTAADPKEFPHQAVLGYTKGQKIEWACGGTLISDRYVLTAAHCLIRPDGIAVQWVRLGDLDLSSNLDMARPQQLRVAERIKHPNYKLPVKYHDIALLKLKDRVKFDAYVRPACLSLNPTVAAGEKAVATGFGVVAWEDDVSSDRLLKVTLPIVSREHCNKFYKNDRNQMPYGISEDFQICAGQDGKDTCQGDSGGPLVTINTVEECMYDVVGITSFGRACGLVDPGVYVNVHNYLAWIEGIVWPNLV